MQLKSKIALGKIFITITILITIIVFVLVYSGREIILDNWNEYKCNPIIVPIAGLYGKDTTDNATKCLFSTFKYYFQFLILPARYIIEILKKLVGNLFEGMNVFRTYMKPIRQFILAASQNFYDQINSFNALTVYSLSKIRNIMKRMSASFRLIIYTLEAIHFTMKSTWDGPVGKVSRAWGYSFGTIRNFFCFTPDTHVLLDDLKTNKISNIPLGSKLYSPKGENILLGYAISYLNNSEIVKYKSIKLTPRHLVFHKGKWTRAEDIEGIKFVDYSGHIVCPITSLNILYTDKDTIVKDFEETSNNKLNYVFLTQALYNLNRKFVKLPLFTDSNIGFLGSSLINGKRASSYKLGDTINNNKILGIVYNINYDKYIYEYNGVIMGANNILYDKNKKLWLPAFLHSESKKLDNNQGIFYQFLSETGVLKVNDTLILDINEGCSEILLTARDKLIESTINL